jgi:hypothetical protein
MGHGELGQLLGTVQGGGVEEQSVAGRERIGLVGVAIEHASR